MKLSGSACVTSLLINVWFVIHGYYCNYIFFQNGYKLALKDVNGLV